MSEIKVIDCSIYNGDPLLEFRLKYLNDVVDEFIITESRHTFTGKIKNDLYLDINKSILEPYKNKITKLIIEDTPQTNSAWSREEYQRNYAYNNYLINKKEDYILFCCDVDEIPRKQIYLNKQNIHSDLRCLHLGMKMFCYNFTWVQHEQEWYHPFVISGKELTKHSLNDFRLGKGDNVLMPNSGWHLSYFQTVNGLVRKLESFSHTEFNKDKFKNKDYIKSCIIAGRHFLNETGQHRMKRYLGQDLPEGWPEIQAKLEDLIFQEETGIG